MSQYKVTDSCQIVGLDKIYDKYFGYKTDGRFVEVGAYDCDKWSNTAFLADIGWKGVYIEPNMCLLQDCMTRHKKNDVYIIGCACGDTTSIDSFGNIERLYLGGSLSTTSMKRARDYDNIEWSKSGSPKEKAFAYIITTTLDRVLKDIGWEPNFDVLVIDTEGTEYEVILGTHISYWNPSMIIVETHAKHPDKVLGVNYPTIKDVLYYQKYDEIYSDIVNSIFVKREMNK